MKRSGYRVVLFFLWLPSAEVAIARVQNRAQQGGHNVPIAVIRRRYTAGLQNFFRLFRPILDEWSLYDGSCVAPNLIASELNGQLIVKQKALFRQVQQIGESA